MGNYIKKKKRSFNNKITVKKKKRVAVFEIKTSQRLSNSRRGTKKSSYKGERRTTKKKNKIVCL